MEISKNKSLFGFNLLEFNTLLTGSTLFAYKYKDIWVGDILEYDEKGKIYHYEDDDIILYYPTKSKKNSIFFFELKKKYLLHENDNYRFYTNFDFSNFVGKLSVIVIEKFCKLSNISKLYYYCIPDYNIFWLKLIKKNKFYNTMSKHSPLYALLSYQEINLFIINHLDWDILFKILDEMT